MRCQSFPFHTQKSPFCLWKRMDLTKYDAVDAVQGNKPTIYDRRHAYGRTEHDRGTVSQA